VGIKLTRRWPVQVLNLRTDLVLWSGRHFVGIVVDNGRFLWCWGLGDTFCELVDFPAGGAMACF
jgi:hypothetical protein